MVVPIAVGPTTRGSIINAASAATTVVSNNYSVSEVNPSFATSQKMSMKEIKRTAVVAWSPPLHPSPLLATGTLAGALDASFSTQAELEIHDLLLDDKGAEAVIKGTISCPSRFNRLAWSSHGGGEGTLVGGCEDGTVSFWNVSELLKNNESAALLARCEAHQGAVRGLQVNPFQPFLVATGATNSEIWLWDLNNLHQPYSPSANKSSKLEDITDLSWNRIVPHILATSSNSGVTVVWDLKSRKEVLQLSGPGQRVSMSALAWNPENATHILVASDDDATPVIYSWDLRNARAPEKVLSGGHGKGVLSLAWCPKDAELLLSGGKDCRALCWNPKSGTLVGELTHSDNWIFDVQWCPRNPDLFSTASFSGRVDVNSFQGVMAAGGAAGMAAKTAAPEDFFASAAATNAISSSMPSMSTGGAMTSTSGTSHVVQIPKWLRRPIGVSFGFGGRLVSFSSLRGDGSSASTPSSRVVIVAAVMIPRTASRIVDESIKLDEALSHHLLTDYCREKIPRPIKSLTATEHKDDDESVFWNVAKILFETNPQGKLLSLLGFDKDTVVLEEQIRNLNLKTLHKPLEDPIKVAETINNDENKGPVFSGSPHDFFTEAIITGEAIDGENGAGASDFDFSALVQQQSMELTANHNEEKLSKERRGTFGGVEFRLFDEDSNDVDKVITRAIIQGHFEMAVDVCVRSGRLSDALLVAICGGDDLVAKTQKIYFQQSHVSYLRLVSGIVKKDLTDVVESAHLDDWEKILALICTHTSSSMTFAKLCGLLGGRLAEAVETGQKSLIIPALIINMAAGRVSTAARLLLLHAHTCRPRSNNYLEYGRWLESLVEKLRIIQQAAAYLDPAGEVGGEGSPESLADSLPAVSEAFLQYAYVMANSGLLEIAVRYYNSIGAELGAKWLAEREIVRRFAHRLSIASQGLSVRLMQSPQEPIDEPVNIQSEVSNAAIPLMPETGQPQIVSSSPPLQQHSHHQFARAPQAGFGGPMPFAAPPSQVPMQTAPFANRPPQPPSSINQPTGATSLPPWSAAPRPSVPVPNPVSSPAMMTAPRVPSTTSPTMPQLMHQPNIPPPPSMQSHPTPPVPHEASSFPPKPPQPQAPVVTPHILNPYASPSMGPRPVQPPPLPQQSNIVAERAGPNASFSSPYAQHPPMMMSGVRSPPPSIPDATRAPPMGIQSPPSTTLPSSYSGFAGIPAPPRPISSGPSPTISASGETSGGIGGGGMPRRAPGPYNDPPMVAPRAPPVAPSASTLPNPLPLPMTTGGSGSMGEMPRQATLAMSSRPSVTSTINAAPTPVAPTLSNSQTSPGGPVDPNSIPANLQPIYRTFSTLILQCQERALPMQRRVVEDSARKMQVLFHQIAQNKLSPNVTQVLLDMCSLIGQGQYEKAHELHHPLMTGHFAETGAWILAAKRLIEVAKICLH